VEHQVGAHRYRLLEPVRQYARSRLVNDDDVDGLHLRYAEYYVQLVLHAEPDLSGPAQVATLDQLELEQHHLRAVLRWLRERGDSGWRGLRLATALWRFWWLRSYFSEGRQQLIELLTLGGEQTPPLLRGRALHALGELAFRRGDVAAARPWLERARALFEAVDDPLGVALTCRSLGRLALDEGDHAQARVLLEADLRMERALDHRVGLPWALTYLSWLAIFAGDHGSASQLLDEGMRLCRELGDNEGVGRHLFSYGCLALDQGRLAVARTRFAEALSLFVALDYQYGVAYALEGLSDVAAAAGQPDSAVRWGGAAAAVREETGAAPASEFRRRHEQWLDRARAGLDDATVLAAWSAGRRLSPRAVLGEITGAGGWATMGDENAPGAMLRGTTASSGSESS
jgi:tetratricopeptide (TPR) repeat protein